MRLYLSAVAQCSYTNTSTVAMRIYPFTWPDGQTQQEPGIVARGDSRSARIWQGYRKWSGRSQGAEMGKSERSSNRVKSWKLCNCHATAMDWVPTGTVVGNYVKWNEYRRLRILI